LNYGSKSLFERSTKVTLFLYTAKYICDIIRGY